jgi:hypothetical protein
MPGMTTPGTSLPQTLTAPGGTTTPPAPAAPEKPEAADVAPTLEPIPESNGNEAGSASQSYRKPTDSRPTRLPVPPIPDREAGETSRPAELAPPWLNPDGQTAGRLLPYRWAAAPIAWPKPAAPIAASHTEPAPPAAPPAKKRWDDSGWRSVNR